jgi:hypothetical protein
MQWPHQTHTVPHDHSIHCQWPPPGSYISPIDPPPPPFPPAHLLHAPCCRQVRRFIKFNLGEGLEKKSNDFAAEVAQQTQAKAAAPAKKEEPKKEEAPAAAAAAKVGVGGCTLCWGGGTWPDRHAAAVSWWAALVPGCGTGGGVALCPCCLAGVPQQAPHQLGPLH